MNLLLVHFEKRKIYRLEVTMDSRLTHCYCCFFSFGEKEPGLIQYDTESHRQIHEMV